MAKASDFEGKKQDELFYFVDYSPEEAERVGYSNYSYWGSVIQNFLKHKAAVVCLILFLFLVIFSFIALAIGKYDYQTLVTDSSLAFRKPNSEYWFGTDNLGRDYWCQVWYATQVSIRLALIVAVGESILGVIIGLIWGYVRKLDRFFTELYNLIDNVPYIIYMTLIALVVGQSFTIMAVSMIAIGWLVMARRVRNMVFMFRDREYNLASRCLGTPLWRVLTKNILPYLVSVIILRMALSIPATINLESTLSYLGIGLGIETPSLGLILSKVRGFFLDYPYLLVFPASIVSIISISFYIMGNTFSDTAPAIQPRSTESGRKSKWIDNCDSRLCQRRGDLPLACGEAGTNPHDLAGPLWRDFGHHVKSGSGQVRIHQDISSCVMLDVVRSGDSSCTKAAT